MPEQPTLPKTRKRAARRNFAKEVSDMETYCRISIDILHEGNEPLTDYAKGKIRAYEQMLSKIGGNNGRA